MKPILLFVGTLLWAIGADAAPATPSKDCSLQQLVSVDLVLEDDGVYVPVTFNGQPAWLALTTDGSISSLRQSALGELKLPMEKSQTKEGFYWDMNEKRVTQVAAVERLTIGSLPVPAREWMVLPETSQSKSLHGLPVAGRLAMDILWRFDFELDLLQRKLILFSQNHCPGQGAYWSDNYGRIPIEVAEFGNIYIAVDVDGRKIEASFATSQGISIMSTTVARRVFGITETVADVETASGFVTIDKFFSPKQLALGDLTIPEVSIGLAPPVKSDCMLSRRGRPSGAIGFNGCYSVYPLEIGLREMAKLRLFFALRERVVYFTYADGTNKDSSATPATVMLRKH